MLKKQNSQKTEGGASDLIDRYLDGLLSEEEREGFELRCFKDDAFFMEVREREKLRQKLAQVIHEEGEAIFASTPARPGILSRLADYFHNLFNLKAPLMPRWGYAIAAVSAVTVIGLLIYRNMKTDQRVNPVDRFAIEKKAPSKPAVPNDSTGFKEQGLAKLEIDAKQLYAANFAPLPHLENWLEETTRSESTTLDSVYSPRPGQKIISKEIVFHWRMNAKAPISLRIQTNTEKELFSTAPDLAAFPEIKVRVKTEIFKEPGLYYWKIEDANDVLFVGKFIFLPEPENKFSGSKLKSPEGDSLPKGK